jgi:hypothetical protein
MECPYCGAELIWHDYYGKMKYADHYYLYPQSWIEKEGDIYKCPNFEGFEDKREAKQYQDEHLNECEGMDLDEVVCGSYIFNGYFYTDERDNLHEGYPC